MHLDSYFKILTDNRLIFAITLLLTVFLAFQLSSVIWQVVPLPAESDTSWFEQSIDNKTVEKSLSTSQKTNQIASNYLFGQAEKQSKVTAPVQVQDAPESSLNYKLRGIYYSEDESLASVILEKGNNKTNFYRLGDEIDNKIYINQINENNILISRLGKLEKLVMEKPKANLNTANDASQSRSSTQSNIASTQVLKSYKRRYADNPLALAKRFQAIPVSENGKNIGYKLKALRGERLLRKLNLQSDDVFVAVNGIGLDKPFQALDALKSLTTADNVSLTVIRNGNRETLDFNLQ